MAYFTLDIKDNITATVKTYTVKYTLQTNHLYAVDLFDDTGKLVFESGCDGAVICFDKVRNFIYTFGKIQTIHTENNDDENRPFQEQLLSKLHTISFTTEGVKFQIRYYDDRTDVSSFGTNFNGLIKVLLIDDAGRSKEKREQIMNDHRLEITEYLKNIVSNNNNLYGNFDIIYEFDEHSLNTSLELIKTFKINPKSDNTPAI